MHEHFNGPARLMGIGAATTVLTIGLAYGVTLALGFVSLPSPDQPIANPYFTVLEALILLLAPAMVALMVAVHSWAPPPLRPFSLAALCLMVMLATETCCVHFVILTLSHQPAVEHQAVLPPPAPIRHAGLVPASTAPHNLPAPALAGRWTPEQVRGDDVGGAWSAQYRRRQFDLMFHSGRR